MARFSLWGHILVRFKACGLIECSETATRSTRIRRSQVSTHSFLRPVAGDSGGTRSALNEAQVLVVIIVVLITTIIALIITIVTKGQ